MGSITNSIFKNTFNNIFLTSCIQTLTSTCNYMKNIRDILCYCGVLSLKSSVSCSSPSQFRPASGAESRMVLAVTMWGQSHCEPTIPCLSIFQGKLAEALKESTLVDTACLELAPF